jgi:hypothetical protein
LGSAKFTHYLLFCEQQNVGSKSSYKMNYYLFIYLFTDLFIKKLVINLFMIYLFIYLFISELLIAIPSALSYYTTFNVQSSW